MIHLLAAIKKIMILQLSLDVWVTILTTTECETLPQNGHNDQDDDDDDDLEGFVELVQALREMVETEEGLMCSTSDQVNNQNINHRS